MTLTKINPSVLLHAWLSDSANKSVETKSWTVSRKFKMLEAYWFLRFYSNESPYSV